MRKRTNFMLLIMSFMVFMSFNFDSVVVKTAVGNIQTETSSVKMLKFSSIDLDNELALLVNPVQKPTNNKLSYSNVPPGFPTPEPNANSDVVVVEEDENDYDDLKSTYFKSKYSKSYAISEKYSNVPKKLNDMLKKGAHGTFSSLTPKLFTIRSNKIVFKKNTYGAGTLNVKIKDGDETFNIKIPVIHYTELDIIGVKRVNKNTIQLKFRNFKKGVNLGSLKEGKNGVHTIQRDRNKKDKKDKVIVAGLGKERTVHDYKKVYDKVCDPNNVKIKVYGKKGTGIELYPCLDGDDYAGMGYWIWSDIKLKDIKKLKKNKWYGEKTAIKVLSLY